MSSNSLFYLELYTHSLHSRTSDLGAFLRTVQLSLRVTWMHKHLQAFPRIKYIVLLHYAPIYFHGCIYRLRGEGEGGAFTPPPLAYTHLHVLIKSINSHTSKVTDPQNKTRCNLRSSKIRNFLGSMPSDPSNLP